MIFLLPLFGATFKPNLKFLAYACRELWPAGKIEHLVFLKIVCSTLTVTMNN